MGSLAHALAFQLGADPVAARGIATSGVLVLDPDDGATVTYSWETDILRSYSGKEHRIALAGAPRETYSFSVCLTDAQLTGLQATLVARQAAGGAFGVALGHESLLLTATSSSTTMTVQSTGLSDWVYPGQTCIVLAPDGVTAVAAVVQSSTTSTIVLDVAPGSAVAVAGARIMPTIPCWLDDTQTMSLYPVNAGKYAMKARATYFGNATGAWAPVGASLGAAVTTYTDATFGVTYPVFDRPIHLRDTSPRASVAMTELTDRGGVLLLTPRQTLVDFSRQVVFVVRSDVDRQYLKLFHGAVLGQQGAFFLPTWKPDFSPRGDASTGVLQIDGPPTANTIDYAHQWASSLAHRHVMLVRASDGAVAYRTITDSTDLGGGVQAIQLDASFSGALSLVCFLETCRFDSDDIVVQYTAGGTGFATLPIRTIEQA